MTEWQLHCNDNLRLPAETNKPVDYVVVHSANYREHKHEDAKVANTTLSISLYSTETEEFDGEKIVKT